MSAHLEVMEGLSGPEKMEALIRALSLPARCKTKGTNAVSEGDRVKGSEGGWRGEGNGAKGGLFASKRGNLSTFG